MGRDNAHGAATQTPESKSYVRKALDPVERARIDAIITKHLDRLSRARGFLGARPGFPIVKGELQREPAVIVYVRQKLDLTRLDDDERLPRVVDGVPIDVMVADPHTQLELLAAAPPPTGARDMATAEAAEVAAAVVAAQAVKPTYEPLPGNPDRHATRRGSHYSP